MDERSLQLKALKKEYKQLKRKTALGWKLPGCVLMHLCFVMLCITVFVRGNALRWVQYVDTHWWEPLKAFLGWSIPYGEIWLFAAKFGILICVLTGVAGIACLALSRVKKSAVKKSEAYLTYRTLKLTLETEKEEKR